MQSGTLNGKVGGLTMLTVAYHTGEKRYIVSPKIPPGRAIPVTSEEEGKRVAEYMYHKFANFLMGNNGKG